MSELKEVWSYKGHDGYQKIFRHYSQSLKSEHEFSIYLPPKALLNQKCPVMYWCTGAAADDREFVLKSGVQKYASERNMIVVAPEPRPGPLNDMPKEISAEYFVQFGFYVDATEPPYSETFRMHTYIMEELLPLIDYKFPVLTEKRGIAGHSMGGMASLVFGLRNTNIFQSISCMSPISNPTGMPIGQSLMKSYFGDKKDEEGPKYDPSLLIKNYEGPHRHILVDQVSCLFEIEFSNDLSV